MRILLKTLTWRVVGSSSTFLISYAVTGQAIVATGITIGQMVANSILYYIHERIWERGK